MSVLHGQNIRLEELSLDHIERLCESGNEPDGWFARMYGINSSAALRAALKNRLKSKSETSRSFVTTARWKESLSQI